MSNTLVPATNFDPWLAQVEVFVSQSSEPDGLRLLTWEIMSWPPRMRFTTATDTGGYVMDCEVLSCHEMERYHAPGRS